MQEFICDGCKLRTKGLPFVDPYDAGDTDVLCRLCRPCAEARGWIFIIDRPVSNELYTISVTGGKIWRHVGGVSNQPPLPPAPSPG